MEFVNSNDNLYFRKLQKNENKFYIHGYTNIDDSIIFESLCNNKFPEHIRGQFAFVFLSNDEWIACVDHFCTTNLFYTTEVISPNITDCATTACTINKSIKEQLYITRSFSVGEETIYNGISQLQPEHYIKNNKQIRYSDIANEPITALNTDDLYNAFVDAIDKIDLIDPVLCFSGGRDSAFLSMLLTHLGYDHKRVFITSKHKLHRVDDTICYQYKELGWDIEYYNVEYSGGFTKELFWDDDTFPPKQKAIKKYSGTKLTGEIGIMDDIRMTKYAYYTINKPASYRELINLFLLGCHTHKKKGIPDIVSDEVWGGVINTNGYYQLLEFFTERISSIDKPNFEKYFLFNYVELSRYRLAAYSQDKNNTWFHMYTDYNIQKILMHLPLIDRFKEMHKYPYYKIGSSKFKNWTDISWNVPAIGLGIPMQESSTNFKFRDIDITPTT